MPSSAATSLLDGPSPALISTDVDSLMFFGNMLHEQTTENQRSQNLVVLDGTKTDDELSKEVVH